MKPNTDNETVSETDDQELSHQNDGSRPDADHAIEFLQQMHGIKPDGKTYIYRTRTITNPNHPDCGKAVTELAVFTTPDRIKGLWWKDSAHLFAQTFAVGTIRDDDKHNQADNIVSYPAAWCDIDACKKLGIPGSEFFAELRESDPMEPTCRVRSSENGIQMYFILDQPLRADGDPGVFDKELKRLLCDMAYYYGGDFKVVLPSALMRLPGSVNVKKEYTTPYPVRAYWDADADQRRYSLAQLQQKFASVSSHTVPRAISYAIVRAMADVYQQGGRNELALHLAGTVRDAGMDQAGCLGLFKNLCSALGDDSDRVSEVERTYKHKRPQTLAQDYPELHKQIVRAVELWVEMKEEYSKKIGIAWSGTRKKSSDGSDQQAEVHHNYRETPQGLCVRKEGKEGAWDEPISTFTARIEAEVSEEDGAERRRHYEIALVCHGKTFSCRVPVDEYDSLKWVSQQASSKAVILPPRSNREEVAAAIKLLSDPAESVVYTHTGWVAINGKWFYCNGNGVIGGKGVENPGIEVRLTNALEPYKLPPPPEGADLTAALRAVLELLKLGKATVMFPILATTFRAPLGPSDFTMFLVGESGAFKSEVAGLAQRFYGPTMNGRRLPGSWMSTENALESTAYDLKDALYVIDDFAPTGGPIEVSRLHTKAERIIRAQGNNAGRQRASRDGTPQRARPPRGLILSTGEDMPRGHSLRGRTYMIEIKKGDIDKERLTQCQKDAAAGVYAQAMSGFIASLAPKYAAVLSELPARVERLRGEITEEMAHTRTKEIVANLLIGLRYFLEFACDGGAISDKEMEQLYLRGRKAVLVVAQEQAAHQQESEPVDRFLSLLRSAIAGGRAHVLDARGDRPVNSAAHGWRIARSETDDAEAVWGPGGDMIGWVVGEDLYLNMEAAYRAAQQMGRESGDVLATGVSQLAKRLVDKGLAKTEASRKSPYIRKTLSGSVKPVLHLAKSDIIEEGAVGSTEANAKTPD